MSLIKFMELSRKVGAVIKRLDCELIGMSEVKKCLMGITYSLTLEGSGVGAWLESHKKEPFGLHMSFTGGPGTGKSTVAAKVAEILAVLGFISEGHLVTVTRDDLVAGAVGQTAPKTKEVLRKAMGGVLLIDEAHSLYQPNNERDYGLEAIEVILQVMENQREDLVIIFAGYEDQMDCFYASNPGLASRVAHHMKFPDYDAIQLLDIAHVLMLRQQVFSEIEAFKYLYESLEKEVSSPSFANVRTVISMLDRAKLRHAKRLGGEREFPLLQGEVIYLRLMDMVEE